MINIMGRREKDKELSISKCDKERRRRLGSFMETNLLKTIELIHSQQDHILPRIFSLPHQRHLPRK